MDRIKNHFKEERIKENQAIDVRFFHYEIIFYFF